MGVRKVRRSAGMSWPNFAGGTPANAFDRLTNPVKHRLLLNFIKRGHSHRVPAGRAPLVGFLQRLHQAIAAKAVAAGGRRQGLHNQPQADGAQQFALGEPPPRHLPSKREYSAAIPVKQNRCCFNRPVTIHNQVEGA